MAKRKNNGSDGTVDLRNLDDRQRRAVDMLSAGDSDAETAEAVGVTLEVLGSWRLYHPGFQAALNRRNQATWAEARRRLRTMLPRALDRLSAELDGENGGRVAMELVKLCGVVDRDHGLQPFGPTDPERIIQNHAGAMDDAFFQSVGRGDPEVAERNLAARLAMDDADTSDS